MMIKLRFCCGKFQKGGEKVKKLLFISLAVVLALGVGLIGCGGGGGGGTGTVTIKVATYFGPTTGQCGMLDAFCNDLEYQSGGCITCLKYWGGTLAGASGLYPGAADGSIDIIFVMLGYTPGRFPPMDLFARPLGIPSAWSGSHVVQDFYNTYGGATNFTQFSDTHPLFFSMSAPLVMYTNTPVQQASDLGGLKIRSGPPNGCIITSLGATLSTIAMADVYLAIKNNQIQGCMIGCDGFTAWSLGDVCNYTTFPYVAGGDVFICTMSNNCWNNKLTPALQTVVANVAAQYANTVCTMWTNENAASLTAGQNAGVNFIGLNCTERAAWNATVSHCIPDWVTTMVGNGYNETVVWDWLNYTADRLTYWVGCQTAVGPAFNWGWNCSAFP
jgi:TRAP-type C4-dicarboxylate transport system substrate-binding protein